jgi:hypothetical protein
MISLFNKRKYFLITSHGNTGTLWLSANLNSHSEIFCTHNYYYPIVEPLQKVEVYRAKVKVHDNLAKNFWQLSVKEFFQQHEKVTKKRIIGNVHAFTIGRLLGMLPALRGSRKRKLSLMNMVRHPISRISSCFHTSYKGDDPTFISKKDHFINKDFNTRCQHIINFINEKNYKLEMSHSDRCFIVALLQSEDVAKDVALTYKHNIENFIFEKIQEKDSDYYNHMFNKLTGLRSTDRYVNFDNANIKNQHNPKKESCPYEIFEAWEDWQKEVFKFIFVNNSMRDIYSKIGYDFSFLK